MDWFFNLMTNHESVAYTVIIYSIVIAVGVALGKVRIGGVSVGYCLCYSLLGLQPLIWFHCQW